MMKILLILLTLLLGSVIRSGAQPGPESLEQLVSSLYAQGKLHGGVLVSEGGEVILKQAWGIANQEKGEVLTPQNHFYLNSLGKMFTSVLIMQMVEEGLIDLNDPLSELYPGFDHPRAADITVHMLLSHRSGIPDYAWMMVRGELPADMDPKERLAVLAGLDLDFEPDTRFNYSNTGFYLLGLIIEKYRKKPYGEVLRERLFEPLGMKNTSHEVPSHGSCLPVYYMQDGTTRFEFADFLMESGDGGIGTMDDLHIFLGALGSEELLTSESWELMFTPHSLPSEKLENAWPPPHQDPYGYGFSLPELPYEGNTTARAVGHGGAGLGSNYVVRFLDSNRIVIIWNNIYKNPVLPEIFNYLAGD